MKLFLREHRALMIFTIIQIFIVILVFWLDGYDRPLTAFYAAFLGICIFTSYLFYRYLSHLFFYKKLSNSPQSLDESTIINEKTPLSSALHNYLGSQYRHFQYQLESLERQQQDHTAFMNQWVHQMKTPLSVIELIIQENDHPQFESIAEETDRMRKGLDMALYISRLDTFKEDFFVQEVSLFEIADKVILDNKRYFIRNYVYPKIKIREDLTLKTDAKWLRFIIDQLITNAIKYSSGNRKKIIISAVSTDQEVILEIKDYGAGISAADLPRVFHPFFTGENGRLFKESTGMGLYLVKTALDKLKHNIEIESEVGKGTTVRIAIPYNPVS